VYGKHINENYGAIFYIKNYNSFALKSSKNYIHEDNNLYNYYDNLK